MKTTYTREQLERAITYFTEKANDPQYPLREKAKRQVKSAQYLLSVLGNRNEMKFPESVLNKAKEIVGDLNEGKPNYSWLQNRHKTDN